MTEQITCEKCGAQMEILQKCGSIGMTCPNCGWGWVTTDSHNLFDPTRFTITIHGSEKPDAAAIRAVSKACRCNFREAQDRLIKGCVITDCSASEAKRMIELLDQGNVAFENEPSLTEHGEDTAT